MTGAATRGGPLVSTEWLAARLQDPAVQVLDATWFLPSAGRDAKAEFLNGHIPGAAFFDIDAVADRSSSLPHMLPSPDAFAQAVSTLGIFNETLVLVYDANGFIASARAWWMFRAMGHENVRVLDGGFQAWRAEGRPVETGESNRGPLAAFEAQAVPQLVRNFEAVRRASASGSEQVVDARSVARFAGEASEPRPGLRSGHIPGSLNLPYGELIAADGRMQSSEDIRRAFHDAGVAPDRPIVTSCGSGVSACVLVLALAELGRWDAAVYDGSWTEWAARAGAPVAVG